MLMTNALPGTSYVVSGQINILGPTYIIPVSAINFVLGTKPIGTGESFERLIYGLLQATALEQKSGILSQPLCGVEVANKSITGGTWETTTNNFTNVSLVNHLVSTNFGTTVSVFEDPSNIVSL